MRAFLAVSLLAVAAADQTASASAGYGAPAPAHGYQAGAARSHGGSQGGARGAFSVSPGGFKTPVGSSDSDVEEYQYRSSPYAFDYAVSNGETGAEYAANENSDGTQTTGFYTVALPDGRIQTVKYSVGESGGFNAEVSYEGEAVFPDPSEYNTPTAGHRQGPTGGYKPVAKAAPAHRSGPVYRSNAAKAVKYDD